MSDWMALLQPSVKPLATLNGKEGMVYVINGCAPLDYGVVYYDFRECEENRETASEFVWIPVISPAKEREDSCSKSKGATAGELAVAIIVCAAALISPLPGDEVVAGMTLLAMF